MKKYIIACSESWFINSEKSKEFLNHNYTIISNKEDLNIAFINEINPEYIFFPHWSWIVPQEIHDSYNCIVFHTAPLPIGRGGSPIQNLILRKYTESPVCALRMTNIIDGGPIYLKKNVSLLGSANDIFQRLAYIIELMIIEIIESNPKPIEQKGEPIIFKRRNPRESELPKNFNQLSEIYDHIRMLDADHYPKAFIEYGNLKIEFTNAKYGEDTIKADILIHRK